jgi:isocitrate dehydrogenase kinase/phosphatase
VYIEEKMTPFNLFLQTATVEQGTAAFIDYGHAIKELAANNIFAGDLLWKNFGVTRYGRLVLYDYDEIQPLLDCNFRRIPPPRSHEEEMAATPYFRVDDNDVFPEEWRPFVVPQQPAWKEAFLSEHADLLTPEYWQRQQRQVLAGELHIGLPYSPRHPELQLLAARGAWIDLDQS